MHATRAARRAGLTVHPPLGDVAAASSQSCDRKSKFGLRHDIKLNEPYLGHDEVRILIFDDPAEH